MYRGLLKLSSGRSMVKIKQGGRVAHHADFFSAITHHVNEVQLQLVNNISSLEWISSKLLSGSFGGRKVCVYVCASSFKWYSPITEIYKEILASQVVNIENHAPYSRNSRYAQSLLTRLICARSRISQIICDSLRVTEYPFATLMKKHYTLTWEEHPFLSPIPSPLFHVPFLFDAFKGGYKVLGNNFHLNSYFTERCRWLPLSFA